MKGAVRTSVKLSVFLLVSVLATVLVVNTLRQPLPGSTRTYHAVFTDVQGLVPGSDVRMAGVRVGQVTSVGLSGTDAAVTFDVTANTPVPANAHAIVRYADLLGARYLAITQGTGAADQLPDGGTIPLARTQPALDLTALLGGFRPLFDSIDPKQVNQLAAEIIAVFQGESGTIGDLLNQVIAVTGNLASRDAVIGQVLTNLNSVLGTMIDHRSDLQALLTGLTSLVTEMAGDRQQISAAIDGAGTLTGSLDGLFAQSEPALSQDIGSLNAVAGTLVQDRTQLDQVLKGAPDLLDTIGRATDYGSWVNIYVCNLSVSVAGQATNLSATGPHSEVCQ